jgi:hypothetical protein
VPIIKGKPSLLDLDELGELGAKVVGKAAGSSVGAFKGVDDIGTLNGGKDGEFVVIAVGNIEGRCDG